MRNDGPQFAKGGNEAGILTERAFHLLELVQRVTAGVQQKRRTVVKSGMLANPCAQLEEFVC